uniref:LINE-1 type transposase domain-containing protein 1-like n=1 Tax=Saccoglossus kowalevskii TaxID=10224 RepID=A0ABM0LWV3_SACKO|nr:PREDICTED: LINE-1 type transposase domain-containing protein 1-like [Saccoglossus kowalevskii]
MPKKSSRKQEKKGEQNEEKTPSPSSHARCGFSTPGTPDDDETEEKEFRRFMNDTLTRIEKKQDKISGNLTQLTKRVQELEDGKHDFQTSLEYSETILRELQDENSVFKNIIEALESRYETMKQQLHVISEDQLMGERYSRSYNIKIVGIEEKEKENAHEVAVKFLGDKFVIAVDEVENAHRTGKIRSQKPRHIIVKLHKRPTKINIMKTQKQILQDSATYIITDLPRADVLEKKRLNHVMRQAWESGKTVVFRNGKLYIKKQLFKG